MSRVFLNRFERPEQLPTVIAQALRWILADQIIRPGARLFIKPNLAWRTPTPGVTVTPYFIRTLVEQRRLRSRRNRGAALAPPSRDRYFPHPCRTDGTRHDPRLTRVQEPVGLPRRCDARHPASSVRPRNRRYQQTLENTPLRLRRNVLPRLHRPDDGRGGADEPRHCRRRSGRRQLRGLRGDEDPASERAASSRGA